jgi:acetolactate synthase I/II/III large subunit
VHLFDLAEERGGRAVSPHHEESAGTMAKAVSRMTSKAAICMGMLGPDVANLADAVVCAKVEKSPVIILGGQRAWITEQRVRRDRMQFVMQSGAPLRGERCTGRAVADRWEGFFAR